MRVLIVDDEAMIRNVLKEYVEFEGNEAFEASDGMQAVKLCKENDYDIILMDVMMPMLDGFSAVKEIHKSKDNNLPKKVGSWQTAIPMNGLSSCRTHLIHPPTCRPMCLDVL